MSFTGPKSTFPPYIAQQLTDLRLAARLVSCPFEDSPEGVSEEVLTCGENTAFGDHATDDRNAGAEGVMVA